MLKTWVLLCFLHVSISSSAMGGIWVMEIEYRVAGGSQIGYLLHEDMTDGYEKFIGQDTLFTLELRKKYENYATLEVYSKIIDQEKISQDASFPMHSFFLVETSIKYVLWDDIESLSFRRIWKKDDYEIQVLTNLVLSDTSWIGQKHVLTYPVGNEIGCRLEVYEFGKSKSSSLISEFCKLYLKEELSPLEQKQYQHLLNKLKKRKVVVVEFCGC